MDEITEAVLDSDLPPALQVTMLHIVRQSHAGLFAGTQSQIADARGVDQSTISEQFRILSSLGWLERTGHAFQVGRPPSTEPSKSMGSTNTDMGSANIDMGSAHRNRRSSQSMGSANNGMGSTNTDMGSAHTGKKGISFSLPPLSFPKKEYHSTPSSLPPLSSSAQKVCVADDSATPTWQTLLENEIWEAEPLPDDHPARWDYHPGDWRWEAGMYVLDKLQEHGMLNTHYRRRLRDGDRRGQIASEWGDTFRLLVEQDGWEREEVGATMQWLFETDNWWRRNRTIQSAAALRRTDEEGTSKFDKILQDAVADYEQRRDEHRTAEDVHRSWDESIAEVERELADELPDAPGDAVPAQ